MDDGGWYFLMCLIERIPNAHDCAVTFVKRASAACKKAFGLLLTRFKAEKQILAGGKINVKSLVLLEARPCAGEGDAEIVSDAWDFEGINRRYSLLMKILGERPAAALGTEAAAKDLLNWAKTELEAWLEAVTNDPLLPEKLLPPDYLGRDAWQRRMKVLQHAGRQLHTFGS